MKRDPVTGFEYPFYIVTADVWNPKTEDYDGKVLANVQTYEEAVSMVKKIPVNADTVQVEIIEDGYEEEEVVAIKVAVTDNPSGYDFYDPRTDDLIP